MGKSADVRQSDITPRGDPTSRMYKVGSSSDADKFYDVDAKEEECNCMAWVMQRNRSVRDGRGAQANCKHLDAIRIYERNAGTRVAAASQDAAVLEVQEKQRIADDFEKIRRARKLKKDLQELRDDV